MADIPAIIRQLRGLERHLTGLSRAVTGRIDALLQERISDADRGELNFLTKALKPPVEQAIGDVAKLSKLLAEIGNG